MVLNGFGMNKRGGRITVDICLHREVLMTLEDTIHGSVRTWFPPRRRGQTVVHKHILAPENLILGIENLLLPEFRRF